MLLIIDGLFLVIAFFFIIKFFNSERGLRYLGLLIGSVVILIATAWITLPALHLLAQGLLLLLLIGVPIYFDEQWQDLLKPRKNTDQRLSFFSVSLLAIVMATLSLALTHGLSTKTAEFPQGVVVGAVNLPDGVAANFGSQKLIQVLVSAPRAKWQSLTADSFSANVDVAKQGQGTYDLTVNVSSKLPDVKIIRVQPPKLTVTVEPIIRKTVNLVAKFSGQADGGLVPDDPVFDPDKVEISGPKSVVNDITQAIVKVNLAGQSQKIELKAKPVALQTNDAQIEDVGFSPNEVKVSVPLVKAGKIKTVGVSAKITNNPASGFWVENVTIDPPVVNITGSAQNLSSVSSISTDPISVAGLNADTQLSANLSLPSGITLATDVGKVKVSIKISQTNSTKSISPQLSYDGLSNDLKVSKTDPTSVATLVAGPVLTLAGLVDSQVTLKIDLSAYRSAGTYSVTIKNANFTLLNGLSLVSFLPSAISVTLDAK